MFFFSFFFEEKGCAAGEEEEREKQKLTTSKKKRKQQKLFLSFFSFSAHRLPAGRPQPLQRHPDAHHHGPALPFLVLSLGRRDPIRGVDPEAERRRVQWNVRPRPRRVVLVPGGGRPPGLRVLLGPRGEGVGPQDDRDPVRFFFDFFFRHLCLERKERGDGTSCKKKLTPEIFLSLLSRKKKKKNLSPAGVKLEDCSLFFDGTVVTSPTCWDGANVFGPVGKTVVKAR